MLDAVDATNVDSKGIPFTVRFSLPAPCSLVIQPTSLLLQIRTVFVIDPKKVIRLTISYPAQTGRSFDEILRVIDSLQLGDKHRITTPVNWKHGDDVIVHPGVSNDEAKKIFPNFKTLKVRLSR
jgi:glutaredoxin/glutathione-dependent peroxiredoxin